jgi:hypothetical protein
MAVNWQKPCLTKFVQNLSTACRVLEQKIFGIWLVLRLRSFCTLITSHHCCTSFVITWKVLLAFRHVERICWCRSQVVWSEDRNRKVCTVLFTIELRFHWNTGTLKYNPIRSSVSLFWSHKWEEIWRPRERRQTRVGNERGEESQSQLRFVLYYYLTLMWHISV